MQFPPVKLPLAIFIGWTAAAVLLSGDPRAGTPQIRKLILFFVLLLVLGIGAFLGARSGLLWQVARVVTFFLAVYACIHYHGIAAGWLLQNIRASSPVKQL